MLKIATDHQTIVLTDFEHLKKYQLSQLTYYGYVFISTQLTLESLNVYQDLTKLITYLKEEAIPHRLTAQTIFIYNSITHEIDTANELFKLGDEIKKGEINNDIFGPFLSFLDTLPRKLKPHQIKSAIHLYALKNAANFSVPGSGKTTVVLSVYEKLRREGKVNILLVIGPPACFQPWKNEFHDTLGREANSKILSGGKKDMRKAEYFKSPENVSDIYLTTFQTVLNDLSFIIKFLSQKGINAFVVIDEAHYIKQIGGSWANALLTLSSHAAFRCVLTGTPIPKGYSDIYNLFDFLWKESSPLTQEDKIQISAWEKKKQPSEAKFLLQERIGALFYRVRKKDLGLKPAIFHRPIIITMNPKEQEIYRYTTSKITSLSESEYFRNEELLYKLWRGRMIRLRQAISYPKLLSTIIDDYDETFLTDSDLKKIIKKYDEIEIPAKLEKLTSMVLELRKQNQKVLIWSNFIGTLELICAHFRNLSLKCELIYGKTPIRKDDESTIAEEKTREDIRDEFVDPESGLDILIANPAACAESISLHKTCYHAIYYDLSYNCAQYIQSLDRIHRVGGSEINEANYYFLQYKDSIDQDIKKNLEVKAERMYDLIEQDYTIYDLDIFSEPIEDDVDAYKRIFINKSN